MSTDYLSTVDMPLRLSMGRIRSQMQELGYGLLAYCGYRSPQEQARLYRRSRSYAEIVAKMAWYEQHGLGLLAQYLERVGPQAGQIGAHVTQAGPGESWHQYRQAVDAVPVVDSRLCWDYPAVTAAESDAWVMYQTLIGQEGLTWGGTWATPDACHVQLSTTGGPLDRAQPSAAIAERQIAECAARYGWDD